MIRRVQDLKSSSLSLNPQERTHDSLHRLDNNEADHILEGLSLCSQRKVLIGSQRIRIMSQGTTESVETNVSRSQLINHYNTTNEEAHQRGDIISIASEISLEEENIIEISNTQSDQLLGSNHDCEETEGYAKEAGNFATHFSVSWNNKYDEILIEMVGKYRNNWKRISKLFCELTKCKTTSKDLKRKYQSIMIERKHEKVKFTREDDLIIVKSIEKLGLNWSKIACNLEGKTPTMIKNRFYSYIKKRGKYNEYLKEIDQETLQVDLEFEGIKTGILKIFPEENDPIYNQTFFEINVPHPEDLLSTKIFPLF